MNSIGPEALDEAPVDDAPIYDAVTSHCGWSPAQLRPAFQLDALIASSYGTVIVNAALARSARASRSAGRPSAPTGPCA